MHGEVQKILNWIPWFHCTDFFKISLFILAALGLCSCVQAFSSCSVQVLIAVASLVESTGFRHADFSSCSMWVSSCNLWALEHGLSSCGTQANFPRGMWDLRGPRIEPESLALQFGFLTTGPQGRPTLHRFNEDHCCPYLLSISLKDSISWWVYPPNTESWRKVFWHENWGPGHLVSLSTLVRALRRSLWSEMIPSSDYRTHRRENKGENKRKMKSGVAQSLEWRGGRGYGGNTGWAGC